MMNWDAISAIGELIGAVAVLVTLIYLAIQIRKNTRAVERESHRTLLQHQHAIWSLLLNNKELNDVVRRGENDPDDLSEDEWSDFVKYMFMYMNIWDANFQNFRSGNMDEAVYRSWDSGLRLVSRKVGYKRFWELNKAAYTDAFVEHVGDYFDAIGK